MLVCTWGHVPGSIAGSNHGTKQHLGSIFFYDLSHCVPVDDTTLVSVHHHSLSQSWPHMPYTDFWSQARLLTASGAQSSLIEDDLSGCPSDIWAESCTQSITSTVLSFNHHLVSDISGPIFNFCYFHLSFSIVSDFQFILKSQAVVR